MKKLVGKTANGYDVYVIENNNHMMAHKEVTHELIAEAASKVEYKPTFWMDSIDMGRVIGKDACVVTTEKDVIRMQCRLERKLKDLGFSIAPDESSKRENVNQPNNNSIKETKESSLIERAKEGYILSLDELEELGFNDNSSCIMQRCEKNNVEFLYYGYNLVGIYIDDKSIEEIFNLSGRDDLCYYITSDALIYAYEKAGII